MHVGFRLWEQMFSFSSIHRELCFNTGCFTSEEGAVVETDTRWQSRSSLSSPPTYISNDDVILFTQLYHKAHAGAALLSMWAHFDFHWLLILLLPLSPAHTRLSHIHKRPRCLFNEIKVTDDSAERRWDELSQLTADPETELSHGF